MPYSPHVEPVEINLGSYYLRALRADDRVDDRPAVLEGLADPTTRRWDPRSPVGDLADAGAYIGRRAAQWADGSRYSWAVADPLTGHLLGEVGLSDLDLATGTGHVSCWIHPASRGRGVAGQALAAVLRFGAGALGLVEATCVYTSDNLAAARLADRCGFSRPAPGADPTTVVRKRRLET